MSPRWMYLHGFASGPESSKGRAVSAHYAAKNVIVERLDLRIPSLEHLRLSQMMSHVRTRMGDDHERAVLFGSSLGGQVNVHGRSLALPGLAVPAQLGRMAWNIAATPASESSYGSTLDRLDTFSEKLEYAMGIVRHLETVATTPELREANNAVQGPVAEFYSNLPLHEGLWRTVKGFSHTAEAHALTGARRRYLRKTIDSFMRNGADLDAAGKQKLR